MNSNEADFFEKVVTTYIVNTIYISYIVYAVYIPYIMYTVYITYIMYTVYIPYSLHNLYNALSLHNLHILHCLRRLVAPTEVEIVIKWKYEGKITKKQRKLRS
jgi:hypothetical protein